MATLLLELFSEEIPSRMQKGAAEQLQRLILAGFAKAGLKPTETKTFVSPRHLAIQCFGLPESQPDVTEEKKGPKIDAPIQAIDGFLKSAGIPQEQCSVREIGGVKYYFAVIERKGRPTAEVAKDICQSALADFTWPKSMRWGAHALPWVRPLHGIVCLLDKKIVPVEFGQLVAGNVTEGHRFLAPGPLTIDSAEAYEEKLKAAYVVVDFATRRDWVRTEVANLAKTHNLSVVPDEALLDEVTGLVEWPVPLLGSFDKKFLDLPPEVLISEMKVHQRYFALEDKSGKLANSFIAVANMTTKDEGKSTVAGNGRVLRARLSDGEFYWAQDKKTKLEDWGKKLSDVVFHAKVGMMSDKVARIEELAVRIAENLKFEDLKSVKRAARLCKADLTTGMVGEFPELQGIMGRYYALAQKEQPQIADAIRDHYKPLGPNDSLPTTELADIIAIADKLDTINSLFAAGEKPTGSKDPFALRRAALGVLRIIIANNMQIYLDALLTSAALTLSEGKIDPNASSERLREIKRFFLDRLEVFLREQGIRHDVVSASINLKPTQSVQYYSLNPMLIATRAKELAAWFATAEGTAARDAIKRPLNILTAEEKKTKLSYSFIDSKLTGLAEPAEKDLLKALKAAKPQKPADLNALTAPINAFFDKVLVNADDPKVREARLSLLAGVREAANQIADFSKIEG